MSTQQKNIKINKRLLNSNVQNKFKFSISLFPSPFYTRQPQIYYRQ